jgi:hypothetical protein
MLSKLIVASLGIGAAALFAAPIAAADLTNAEVAGGQHSNSVTRHSSAAEVVYPPYGGPSSGYWTPVRDENGQPYTDATGRVVQHCAAGCGGDLGKVRVAPTACGNTAPVNEKPAPAEPASTDASE